ncbi:hypothetical protein BZA77DRAFT_389397 [Pyronema omphalodes]|nr:hypothetical protein BZA77DRAFT_389397 [Pyronema omphalodes]
MAPSLAAECDKLSLSMLADELYDALRGVARKITDDELTTVATSPPDTPVARNQSFAGSFTTEEEYDNFQLYRESPRVSFSGTDDQDSESLSVSSTGTDDEITVEPPSSRFHRKRSNNPRARRSHRRRRCRTPDAKLLKPGRYVSAANILVVCPRFVPRYLIRFNRVPYTTLSFYNNDGGCRKVLVNANDIESLGLRRISLSHAVMKSSDKQHKHLHPIQVAANKTDLQDRKSQLKERRRNIKAKEKDLPGSAMTQTITRFLALGVNANWTVRNWYFGKTFIGKDGKKYTNREMATAEMVRLGLCDEEMANSMHDELSVHK